MKQLLLKSRNYLSIFLIILFLFLSCDKEENQFPEIPVGFTINLDQYNDLQFPGNSIYLPGAGYGGIIICCHIEGEYYAFDAACPHEISQQCTLEADGLTATCPCCESTFTLFYSGTPIDGPAKVPLKQYNVEIIDSNTLGIYN